MRLTPLIICSLFLGGLAGCTAAGGPNTQAPPAAAQPVPEVVGDAQRGQALFAQTLQITKAPTCQTCHVVHSQDVPVVGPSLAAIGRNASTRVPGQSARDYLWASITDTNAFIMPGHQPGIMPRTYRDYLSTQQVADLVAYLEQLEGSTP